MKKEIGSSPGTVIYTGSMRTDISLKWVRYNAQDLDIKDIDPSLSNLELENQDKSWLIIHGIHNEEMVRKLGSLFNLHPLIQEDIANPNQRFKVEEYHDTLFLTLRAIREDQDGDWYDEQFSMVLKGKWCILFSEESSNLLNPLLKRLQRQESLIRTSETDYLGYAIIDLLVDHYLHYTTELSEALEQIEEQVMDGEELPLSDLRKIRKRTLHLKGQLRPLMELVLALQKNDFPFFALETKIYLRDVNDHVLHALEQAESIQENIASTLSFYHSELDLKMNEIMKFLTMIGTLFIPLTFIAGVYGMNFKFMPELEVHWGYPAVILLMFFISIWILLYFKRKKWF